VNNVSFRRGRGGSVLTSAGAAFRERVMAPARFLGRVVAVSLGLFTGSWLGASGDGEEFARVLLSNLADCRVGRGDSCIGDVFLARLARGVSDSSAGAVFGEANGTPRPRALLVSLPRACP
jgi:hypothetical protein